MHRREEQANLPCPRNESTLSFFVNFVDQLVIARENLFNDIRMKNQVFAEHRRIDVTLYNCRDVISRIYFWERSGGQRSDDVQFLRETASRTCRIIFDASVVICSGLSRERPHFPDADRLSWITIQHPASIELI